MKKKIIYGSILSALVIISFGAYFLYPKKIKIMCPEDFPNTDAGDEQRMSALDNWSKEFHSSYPDATVGGWATARRQFYVDNNCAVALKNYDDAIAGKADPEKMNIINNVIKNATQSK